MKAVLEDVVFEDVGDCLLVRSKHDVNLLSLVISHLSSIIRVESSLFLVLLEQVVSAVPELPVRNEVSFPSWVGDLDSLPRVE